MPRRMFRVVLVLGFFAVAAALAPSAPDRPEFAKYAEARIKLARETLDMLDSMRDHARASPTDSRYMIWSRRLVEAERDLPNNKAGYLAACKAHLERMKTQEQLAIAQRENAQLSMIDVNEFRFRRLEAEFWLKEAEAR